MDLFPNLDLQVQNFIVSTLLRVFAALAILLIGRWLAGFVRRYVRLALARTRAASASLTEIIVRTAYYATLLAVVFLALVVLGIPAEALFLIIGVVLVVAAVALRESLRDIAATVIFVIFQPFKVGDQIETNGVVGTVQEILLFNTVLISLDHRELIIPNGNIQNTNLINYSALDKVRLDLSVLVSYGDSLPTARKALLDLAHADAGVLPEPAPVVDLMELGESGISLVLRVYATPIEYWALRPTLNEKIRVEFERLGLTFPYPQRTVHLDALPNPNPAPAAQ